MSPVAAKAEPPAPAQPTSGLLLLPTLNKEHAKAPDKKPEILQSLIMASPDLTKSNPAETPVTTGQLGPALTAPPSLTEASEPPAPKPATVHSDYPSKDQLLDAFQYFLADQPEKVLDVLKRYDSAKQNILLTLLPVIASLTQKPQEPLSPKEVAVILDQVETLVDGLRPRSKLTITNMCFCKSIKAFAIYDPLPEDHPFRASSTSHALDGDVVQVYVELRNFCCERRDDYHEIHLSSAVEIRSNKDLMSQPIWFKRFDDSKQPPVRSRAQLHDYFCRYYFAVPHLPPGDYTMTIKVVDETFPDKRRIADKSLRIRVIAAD